MDPELRKNYWYLTTMTNELFSKPPKNMEDKKSTWRKILEFTIEVLKLVLAIFLGLQASSLL